MLNDNDYMTLVDAAKALNISRQWLYTRVVNGTAPAHITIGKRKFFERSAVESEAYAGG